MSQITHAPTESSSLTEPGPGIPQNLFWNALGQVFDLERYDPIQPEASTLAVQGGRGVVQLKLDAVAPTLETFASGTGQFPEGTEEDKSIEFGDATSETRSIYTRHDFQTSFTETTHTKVAGPLGRNSFSASETYSQTVRTSKQDRRMSTFNERQIVRFGARLQTRSTPAPGGRVRLVLDLAPDFVAAVTALPITGDWHSAYQQFVDTWGTHFAEAIEVGGRAYLTSIFEEDQFDKMVEKDLKVSVAAKGVFRGVSGSGGGSFERQSVEAFEEIVGVSRTQIKTVGGTLQDDLDAWAQTIDAHPGVVNTRLRPLYDLVHEGHFPGDPGIEIKRTLLLLTVQERLDIPTKPVDMATGLLLYKNSEFDDLRQVVRYSLSQGGEEGGLDDLDITSVIAVRGEWDLIADSKAFRVSPSLGDHGIYPHSDSWAGSSHVNDDLDIVRWVGTDSRDSDSVLFLFSVEGLQGDHDSDKRPIRVTESRGPVLAYTPKSALAANGTWMLYRNDDLVGLLLDPEGGPAGEPGQYRTLTATENTQVTKIDLVEPTRPWQPATAPSIRVSDMAHLLTEKDFAKGHWSGQRWTHVRYAVSFATPDGESFLGPWSPWLDFASAGVIQPRIHDLPIDEIGPDASHPASSPSSSRRIYRQFGAQPVAGAPTDLDVPEWALDVDSATSNQTAGFDTKP